jgi:hypothetical protein
MGKDESRTRTPAKTAEDYSRDQREKYATDPEYREYKLEYHAWQSSQPWYRQERKLYDRRYRAKLKAEGKKPEAPEKNRARSKAYYYEHREEILAKRRAMRQLDT